MPSGKKKDNSQFFKANSAFKILNFGIKLSFNCLGLVKYFKRKGKKKKQKKDTVRSLEYQG